MKRKLTPHHKGFTLVEILVATTVLALLLGIMLSVVNHVTAIWQQANSRIEAFQGARRGFGILTMALTQATLNTYWDYQDNQGHFRVDKTSFEPYIYGRRSELRFLVATAGEGTIPGTRGTGQAVFFQAPLNRVQTSDHNRLGGLLNACGFFIEYGEENVPAHINQPTPKRFRLKQWLEPSELLDVYAEPENWIQTEKNSGGNIYSVADNIIALIIWPKEEEPSRLDSYHYDSSTNAESIPQPITANQLPPMLQVALVAIDEASAKRLGNGLESKVNGWMDNLFQSTEKPSETFSDDLRKLESRIQASTPSVEYRILQTTIPLREAKWSRTP